MKIFYDEGYPLIKFGDLEMRMGEPQEVPDELAEELINRGMVKKWEGPENKPDE